MDLPVWLYISSYFFSWEHPATLSGPGYECNRGTQWNCGWKYMHMFQNKLEFPTDSVDTSLLKQRYSVLFWTCFLLLNLTANIFINFQEAKLTLISPQIGSGCISYSSFFQTYLSLPLCWECLQRARPGAGCFKSDTVNRTSASHLYIRQCHRLPNSFSNCLSLTLC